MSVGEGGRSGSDTRAEVGKFAHLSARVFNVPLAITRPKLEVLLGFLGPRLLGATPAKPVDQLASSPTYRSYEVIADGGIAIIPVYGTLIHRALGADTTDDEWSGLTSYKAIRANFDAAMKDPDVATILLDVDSHGGEVSGMFDLADYIRGQRGTKPIVAVADACIYSAAYCIASAADRLYVSRDSGVGSIGVIAEHVDQSKLDQAMGLKITTVFAGERKNDLSPHEPISKTALAKLQTKVDRTYDQFVGVVAKNRGMSEQAVADTQASWFVGEEAVDEGLADAVMSIDEVLDAERNRTSRAAAGKGATRMATRTTRGKVGAERPAPDPDPTNDPGQPAPDTTEDAPDTGDKDPEDDTEERDEAAGTSAAADNVVNLEAFRKEHYERGAKEAAEKERARVKEIVQIGKAIGLPGVAAELATTGISVEEARTKLFEEKAARGPEISNAVSPVRRSSDDNPLLRDAKRRAEEHQRDRQRQSR